MLIKTTALLFDPEGLPADTECIVRRDAPCKPEATVYPAGDKTASVGKLRQGVSVVANTAGFLGLMAAAWLGVGLLEALIA